MERQLVTFRTVKKLIPITGADLIEVAMIDGWQCVVKKGGFREGDQGLYFEIDSFLPIRPEFEFLRKSCYRKLADESEGFRLRTIKLRGQISQGLLLPLTDDFCFLNREGDLAFQLGVIKYEPPVPAILAGQAKGLFPSFIRKTDQERVQNLADLIKENRGSTFEVTEKLDGTSCTIFWNKGDFGVCSRNLELKDTETNSFWKISKDYELETKLKKLGLNLAIQGELIGEGIQKNRYKLKGQDLFVFSIFDIDNYKYFEPYKAKQITGVLGLNYVPVLTENFVLDGSHCVESLLERAMGGSCLTHTQREGLVFKSNDSEFSFKAISNQFLLEEE